MHSQNCMHRDQNSWSTSILLCQTSCSEQSSTHALSVWFTHQLLCTLLVWMFFVVLLPCESTCMHCVHLALWTQVFVWVFMCHICIFIHSFHRLLWSCDLGFVLQAKTHCLYYWLSVGIQDYFIISSDTHTHTALMFEWIYQFRNAIDW